MRKITVTVHHEDGSWWAESPNLPGFSAAADSLSALREEIRGGIAFAVDDEPHVVVEASAESGWAPVFYDVSSFGCARSNTTGAESISYPTVKLPSLRSRTNPRLALT